MFASLKAYYLRQRFWFLDRKSGSPVREQYKEIRFIQEHSYAEGLPIRQRALHALLLHAQQHTLYYADYRSLELADYPVMNKTALIAHHAAMTVAPQFIPQQCGEVFVQKTSGSTGVPLAMPQDTMKRKRRVAEIKYFGTRLGYRSHEKLIHLRTWNKWQTKSGRQIKYENIIPFDIKRLGKPELANLCNIIVREKPVSLRGYASTLGHVADMAEELKMNVPKSLKVVVSTSESLEDEVRAKVKRVLHCECVSQYASEECGIMAQERIPTASTNNKMYFNWSGYYFEFLKLDSDAPAQYGELARIVLTDLHNYAFPVIRYDTGDTCVLLPPDEFSQGYPVMGRLYGRRFDLTYTTDGTPIYPLAYGRILKNYPCIAQWQFVQCGKEEYQLRLVLRDADENTLAEIQSEIVSILGQNARIEIVQVDDIPVLTSGKRKPVINNWNGVAK